MLVRTTIRIQETLKKTVERKAVDMNVTFQDIFNEALAHYLEQDAQKQAKKIVFKTHDLGEPVDDLTRGDYYSDPT